MCEVKVFYFAICLLLGKLQIHSYIIRIRELFSERINLEFALNLQIRELVRGVVGVRHGLCD